ncbi:PLC-like phosphodiesterase [Aspergillus lentulus]|nr:PLC-like phosphodiesterase [Aspergillus lentulus]
MVVNLNVNANLDKSFFQGQSSDKGCVILLLDGNSDHNIECMDDDDVIYRTTGQRKETQSLPATSSLEWGCRYEKNQFLISQWLVFAAC